MKMPPELKPALWGAAGGAAALAFIGFNFAGWVTHGTAEINASRQADAAVVKVLAPICVDKFRQAANAPAALVQLQKIESWDRSTFVEKGGWATMPGSTSPDSSVARACAVILADIKL